ncbi:MAG: MerC domain-containing protein, partial [Fimbriimonas ginsengisoli]|nr:MerC domain-containing protein [Fimbriimonas ginsengisoli]
MAVGRVLRLNLDKVGACASAVCAVHCLLTGLALGLLSVVGFGFLGSLTADIAFLGVALSVGLLAVFHGIRRH